MNIQEAIAVANEMMGQDYFSPQQPAFFVEAARSAGNLDVSAKDPNAPYDWTKAEVEKIVANTKRGMADDDAAVKRDYAMTAQTTPDTRAYVADVLAAAGTSTLLDRPLFYRLAASNGVTIYTERWPGKADGQDFILPADRPAMLSALKAWVKENDDA